MAAFVRVNRNYNFVDKSPICDELMTLVDDTGLRGKKNIKKVALLAGVGNATVDGILYGATRDPRNSTVERIVIGLGATREIRRGNKPLNLEHELREAKAFRARQNKLAREAKKKEGKRPRKKTARKRKPNLRLVSSRAA